MGGGCRCCLFGLEFWFEGFSLRVGGGRFRFVRFDFYIVRIIEEFFY